MPGTLNIAGDFLEVTDNLEAVTLRPPETENSNSELLTNGRLDENLDDWTTSGAVTWEERMALLRATAPYIAQSITTVSGTTYLVAVDVFAAWTTTAPTIRVGTAVNGTQISTQTLTASRRLQFTFAATGTTTWLTFKNGDDRVRFGNVTARASGDAAVASALRRAVSTREAAASGGAYRVGDVKWHLPQSLVANPPALGAIVTDGDGTRWTVLHVDQETWDNRWKCWTRLLSTASDALGTVTIQKRSFVKDADGAQTATLVDWANHVRARIQRSDTTNVTLDDHRRTPRAVSIQFEHQFPLDNRFAVLAADGRIYKITGYKDWHKTDGLFTIDAEESPWPLN